MDVLPPSNSLIPSTRVAGSRYMFPSRYHLSLTAIPGSVYYITASTSYIYNPSQPITTITTTTTSQPRRSSHKQTPAFWSQLPKRSMYLFQHTPQEHRDLYFPPLTPPHFQSHSIAHNGASPDTQVRHRGWCQALTYLPTLAGTARIVTFSENESIHPNDRNREKSLQNLPKNKYFKLESFLSLGPMDSLDEV